MSKRSLHFIFRLWSCDAWGHVR